MLILKNEDGFTLSIKTNPSTQSITLTTSEGVEFILDSIQDAKALIGMARDVVNGKCANGYDGELDRIKSEITDFMECDVGFEIEYMSDPETGYDMCFLYLDLPWEAPHRDFDTICGGKYGGMSKWDVLFALKGQLWPEDSQYQLAPELHLRIRQTL